MPAYEHRGVLHKSQLQEFKTFLLRHGWIIEFTKGEFEILRATHPHWPHPLLAYRNAKNDEVTTANAAYGWALMFRTYNRAHSDAERQKNRSRMANIG
ncbi:hypothetical protein GUH47_02640 [Xanthomonas citri pv. citri]|nr:hypothetical protein ART_00090 [Achromobacter phage vB_Ade_ART]MBD4204908.1 hypothetical protein [Xanthomonas citri pv. citri]